MESIFEGKGVPMSVPAVVDPQAYQQVMQAPFEQTMRAVMEAVNVAANGQWIEGSEHQVRDLMAAFQRKAYETALQMKTQAAEAAFSPSAGGDGGASVAWQGPARAQYADGQRSGGRASPGVSGPAGRSSLAGR
jgi:hypothetical protein